MKKKARLLIVSALTMTLLLLSAGCAPKAAPAAGIASPSLSASQPSGTAQPASPSSGGAPSPASSVPASASPSAKPSEKPEGGSGPAPEVTNVPLEEDSLGSLKLGMVESDLTGYLGEPESKSETVNWGADGLDHTDWYYPSKGLIINMAMSPEDSESYVNSITAEAPCDLATRRGIRLGDTKDAVLKAYSKEYNAEDSGMLEDSIVLGSVFGGIIMDIKDGVVTRIFIGAAAE